MSYIIYIVLNYLDSIDALVGKGGVSWTNVLIGSAVDIFVFGMFFLSGFLLNTKHNTLY